MAEVFEGNLTAKGKSFGIVVSRFNEYVTKSMLEGALNELRRSGVSESQMYVTWVPGAHEIPFACQILVEEKKPNALITLGCIIRGETTHYEHLAQSVTDGIQSVALKYHIPVSLGVLTVENLQQAIDRAGGKIGNKGRDAAKSVIEMACLVEQLKNDTGKEAKIKELINQAFPEK
jgi:6,7-dimethyl-8-ribityllumazine synthase